MLITSDATAIWRILNGVVTIYKPAGSNLRHTRGTILTHLCRDLNDMDVRQPRDNVIIEGETNEPMIVKVGPSLADHPLLVGPRYQQQDFKLSWANYLGRDTSGVVVMGINDAAKTVLRMRESRPTRFYKVKGLLGQATENYFTSGKIVERATYKSIKRSTIDTICASMQASHQRKMFELSGLNMQTQAAYDLAVKGPIRPANHNLPMIYAIKCVEFDLPNFTLEIVCINEYEMYLKGLIHELGMQLHSAATCTQIQCFKYGIFTTQSALLKKHWNLQSIINNMEETGKLIRDNPFLLNQESPVLLEQRA